MVDMQHRLAAIGSCVVVYAVSVGGCGQTDSDGSGGSSGSGSASGLAGNAGVEGEYSGECSVEEAAPACGEDCPVTADLLVFCDASGFGRTGPRVTPRADGPGVHLVTAGDQQAWFVTARAGEPTDFMELPAGFEGEKILLTTTSDAQITLAAETREGITLLDPLEEAATERPFTTEWQRPLTLDYDRSGSLGLAMRSDSDAVTAFVRSPGGEFSTVSTWVWNDEVWPVYTEAGAWIEVRRSHDDEGSFLTADAGAGTYPLHTPLPGPLDVLHAAPALPAPEDAVTDRYVVGALGNGALMIVENEGGDLRELEVSLPTYVHASCLDEHDGHTPDTCPETCEEVTDGVRYGGVGIASTHDGRIWAAWVHTFIDETQVYEDSCWSDDGSGCTCRTEVTRDDTRAEIVLAEVDLDEGEVREALRLSSENVEGFQALTDQMLDVRAFGTELAIGVRVRSSEHDMYRTPIRVIEVDTTRIEAP